MICLDKTKREIKPGSIIVYGHALGRCAALRIGIVRRLTYKGPKKYPADSDWSITVRGIEDGWSHMPTELCKRDGTLLYPERCITLDPTMLTQEQRHLLTQVEVQLETPNVE